MSSTPTDSDLQVLFAVLETNRANMYSLVAALTFCVYDIILSFKNEARCIWGSRLSPIAIMYLVVRYYSVISLSGMLAMLTSGNLDVQLCQRYFWWTVAGVPSIFIITLDTILLLRILALYDRSYRVFIVLLILVLGNFAATQWADITLAKSLASTVVEVPAPLQLCVAEPPGLNYMLAAYVPNFCLSLLFLAMTVWKLVGNHRSLYSESSSWKSLPNMNSLSPLLVTFVRDGSVFFALTSLTGFLGVMSLFVAEGPAQAAFYPWTLALYSYSGSHLVLDLRAAREKKNKTQPLSETSLTLGSSYRFDRGYRDPGIGFTSA